MSFSCLCYIFLIFVTFCRPYEAALRGKCAQCLPNGIACLDEQSFSMCANDIISTRINKCPDGFICTDQEVFCVSLLDGMEPVCADDNCANCALTNGKFACLNETSYGFCFGESISPNPSVVRHCPLGTVCTLFGAERCASMETTAPSCIPVIDKPPETTTQSENPPEEITKTTEEETTSTEKITPSIDRTTAVTNEITPVTEEETLTTEATAPITEEKITTTEQIADTETPATDETTPDAEIVNPNISTTDPITTKATPIDPNSFCSSKKLSGYFMDESDKTCKKYIYCFLLSGQYLGYIYKCSGYFNASTGVCQNDKPNGCTSI